MPMNPDGVDPHEQLVSDDSKVGSYWSTRDSWRNRSSPGGAPCGDAVL